MKTSRKTIALAALAAPVVLVLAAPAHAYVGPGAGLGVIGTLFGIGAAIVLAMFGLFWYPLKRAFGRKAVAGDASAAGDIEGEGAVDARRDLPDASARPLERGPDGAGTGERSDGTR